MDDRNDAKAIEDRLVKDTSSLANDPRATADLVKLFLQDRNSKASQEALIVLHYRGGLDEFNQGQRLAQSKIEDERIAGVNILGQLGWGNRTFLEESVDILLGLLSDTSNAVIAEVAISLGHRNSPRAIQPLLTLVNHPNPDVRYGVVHGLSRHDDGAAVKGLIQLSQDTDVDVRNWATFGIAQQTDLDSPEIRDALFARTGDDEDPEIRGEALLGLARRGERQTTSLIERELLGEFYGDWAVEAAEFLADPTLCSLLKGQYRRLGQKDQESFQTAFSQAIKACCPETKSS